jgi:histone H3/H4
MPVPPPAVRSTTIRKFLKDRTEMRVSEDAVDLMVGLFTTTSEKMAATAAERAVEGLRNTILGRDIQNAFKSILEASGPPLLGPDTIHTAIDCISTESLTMLIQLLRADLDEHP